MKPIVMMVLCAFLVANSLIAISLRKQRDDAIEQAQKAVEGWKQCANPQKKVDDTPSVLKGKIEHCTGWRFLVGGLSEVELSEMRRFEPLLHLGRIACAKLDCGGTHCEPLVVEGGS